MKTLLHVLLVALSGIASAQCDPTFTWNFDGPSNLLTCIANDNNPANADFWNLSDTTNGAGLQNYPTTNIFTAEIPYGEYDFIITHWLNNNGNYTCGITDTIHIENTDGSVCDPSFLTTINYVVPFTMLYGVDSPGLNHYWIYGVDTISTTSSCTLVVNNFSIKHIVYNFSGCAVSLTDTIDTYYDPANCGAGFSINMTNTPNEFQFYSQTGNLFNHIWTINGDTVAYNDYILNYMFNWGGNYTICLTIFNNECNDTWCQDFTVTGVEETALGFEIESPYPNPTSDNIFIPLNAKKAQSLTFTVFNLLGQPVLNQNNMVSSGNQTILLPTESLAQGIYILQIADKKTGMTVTKKIVKD